MVVPDNGQGTRTAFRREEAKGEFEATETKRSERGLMWFQDKMEDGANVRRKAVDRNLDELDRVSSMLHWIHSVDTRIASRRALNDDSDDNEDVDKYCDDNAESENAHGALRALMFLPSMCTLPRHIIVTLSTFMPRVSQNTDAVRDNDYVKDRWSYEPRFNAFYSKVESGQLLTPESMQKLNDLYKAIDE
eukprot:jgi/Bigna1/68028/fgenesh1_pg.5_\